MMMAATLAALCACQSSGKKNVEMMDSIDVAMLPVEEIDEVFVGTLPAADGPGINYVLTLGAMTDGIDTIYTLDMTYLDADGPGKHKTFSTKGKQQTVHKVVNNHPKKAVKLTPETNDPPMFFLIVNDSTLRLVDENLQESTSGLNYDIVLVDE